MHQTTPASHADTGFDPARRFVRVTGSHAHGFIEFEFSIGSDELCVELMLPPDAFDEFCLVQHAERLPAQRCSQDAADE
ncbi:MAG: phenol hydroxylase subunit [Thiomonas sp.]|uniref:phenol hydroxylase subunit n=1 Tax=Thiomonas sp. TaxID=2047785 RepID=UPI002A370FAD|nr:phenol hydroxylase subunit [Thiomonas sp.]MDY0329162.1 phenol hydroxylase subunit [Thiomonas sp.]